MSDQSGRSLGNKMVRFATVGLANTAIDLAAFSLLLWFGVLPLAANVGAWVVAVAFSFTANRFWSFERDHSIKLAHSVFRFVSLGALISLGVSSVFIAGLAGWIDVWPAKIAGVIVAAALNFLAARWSIEGRLLH
ncbi:GtrA family protein [Mesorhizobium retamae]|uniref:GtrA family protein n=1 Tax=Mesorhizobium retamae TaxID=2912854 RepID=A0ABS9QD31_9HYPH|nr:GtrA family protein [Mesorhizobium sp. IRAMC:0171]MCG7504808.1 GtrA family protein [Mesorhizobium sp. IRAMC:0171]